MIDYVVTMIIGVGIMLRYPARAAVKSMAPEAVDHHNELSADEYLYVGAAVAIIGAIGYGVATLLFPTV